jgi:ligand-binding sensor domain-containing protein
VSIRHLHALVLLAAPLLLGGCPPKSSTAKPKPKPTRAQVEVYTESASVNAVMPMGKTLWIGTGQGLVAWDLRELKAKILTVDDGLPGNNILTLASDGKQTLWVGTATGVARMRAGRWTQFGDCPLGDKINTMATTVDGETVWVGGPKGLARMQHERWKLLFRKSGVTALQYLPDSRVLWVGTQKHGALRCKGIQCKQFGADRLGAMHVTSLARSKHGVLAVLAGGKAGKVAYRHKGRWHRYTIKPTLPLHWASFTKGVLFLSAGDSVYQLVPRKDSETPPGPVELDPQTSGAPEFIARKVRRQMPRRVTVVKQALGSLWLGSQRLGVARFNGDLLQYFRTNDLTEGARRLSLACPNAATCYMATGNRLYKKSGPSMIRVRYPADNDAVFQWVGKDRTGGLLTVLRARRGSLEVARLSKSGKFTALELEPAIHTKQGPLQATFARVGPAGKLWIGLAIEESDDNRGAGMAVVDLATGAVIIHGRGAGLPTTEGGLGITSDLSGAAFAGGQAYLGSRGGVIRISGNQSIKVFTENDGLKSEIINDIVKGPGGHIYAATSSGLGVYDGRVWRFHDGSDARTNKTSTLLLAPGGAIWFGGPTGLHRLHRNTLTSYDEVDGLLTNEVLSIAIGPDGRIWAAHKNGLSIVRPKQ